MSSVLMVLLVTCSKLVGLLHAVHHEATDFRNDIDVIALQSSSHEEAAPYADAFRCLHPPRAVGSAVTMTSLEVLLLRQHRNPEMGRVLIEALLAASGRDGARESDVPLDLFQQLMRGDLSLSMEILTEWHDVISQACFLLEGPELQQWRGHFDKSDIDGDGYVTETDFNMFTSESTDAAPVKLVAMLFGAQPPGTRWGFYQFVATSSAYYSKMLYRTLQATKSEAIDRERFTSALTTDEATHRLVRTAASVLTDATQDAVWAGLDEDKSGSIGQEELAANFLPYFMVNNDGTLDIRSEEQLRARNKKLKFYTRQCESAVMEECVVRTCPKFCSDMARSLQGACSRSCTTNGRCKQWQPGLATFAEADDVVEQQTFAQVIACIASKRRTSGYDGGNWQVVTTPSYRKVFVRLSTKQMPKVGPPSASASAALQPGDAGGVAAATEGVLRAVSEGIQLGDPNGLQDAAHKAWAYSKQLLDPRFAFKPFGDLDDAQRNIYAKVVEVCAQVLLS